QELMAITVKGIRIYLFMFPFVSISIIGSTYFQSIGKARIAMILSLLRQLILLVPLLLVLPPFLGLDGVWLAQPISDTLAISITLYFLVKQFKKMKRLELAKGEKH
ncbi:MATE family efflux transporter, partial [Turicibacter sanguinis]|nr:MATE family efflux transporter [Turicibacter sanguinis]MTL68227.1 MATE family efflux transporter [Turicibacter sanguinis]